MLPAGSTGQMGVKTKKAYRAGEEVLREYPVMRVYTSHPASSPEEPGAKFARAVQEAYDACSEPTQACREVDGKIISISGRTLQRVFATNTYALGQGATHGRAVPYAEPAESFLPAELRAPLASGFAHDGGPRRSIY